MRTDQAAVKVIIVAYGDPGHLRACLASLGAPAGSLLIVDNGASEEVRALAADAHAEYLRPPGNLGFAAGVNVGLRALGEASCDVLLLNPDAQITWADVLRLQDALHATPRRAAVAPLLQRPDGSPEAASWPVPSPGGQWLDALGLGRWSRTQRFLTGACLLISGEALSVVGEFDERFFLYAEESDWQLRALRAGWSVCVVDDVTAVHVGSGTSSDPTVRSAHFHRSAREFARKWYGSRGSASMQVASVVALTRRAATGGANERAEARQRIRQSLRRKP